jgi:hypothetical protein
MFALRLEHRVHKSIIDSSRLDATEAQLSVRKYDGVSNREERQALITASAKRLESSHQAIYKGLEWREILIQHLYEAVSSHPELYKRVFGHADEEAELYPRMKRYLEGKRYTVFPTDKMRKLGSWPDLYAVKGTKGALVGKNTISIDAKVSYDQFKRFLQQSKLFSPYSNQVFACTTPGMIAELGMRIHKSVARGEKEFKDMLDIVGAGAYVIDFTRRKGDEVRKVHNASGDNRFFERSEQKKRLEFLGYDG